MDHNMDTSDEEPSTPSSAESYTDSSSPDDTESDPEDIPPRKTRQKKHSQHWEQHNNNSPTRGIQKAMQLEPNRELHQEQQSKTIKEERSP